MNFSEYLAAGRGRAAELARLLGVAPSYLSQIAGGGRPAPADRCAEIEAATGGAVRRWDLRPDDWHRIWPELIGVEGAPAVEGVAAPRRELMPASAEPASSPAAAFVFGGRREDDHTEPVPLVNGNGPKADEQIEAIGALTGDAPRQSGNGQAGIVNLHAGFVASLQRVTQGGIR